MSMSLMSFWYKATAELGLPTYKISEPELITNQFNKQVMDNWYAKSDKFTEILELPIDQISTNSLIKKQYRKLALKHHPDKCEEHQKPNCTKKFHDITAAEEFLKGKNDGIINPTTEIQSDSNLSMMKNYTDLLIEHNETITSTFNNYLSHYNSEILSYYDFNVTEDAELLGLIFYELGIVCD